MLPMSCRVLLSTAFVAGADAAAALGVESNSQWGRRNGFDCFENGPTERSVAPLASAARQFSAIGTVTAGDLACL